MIDLGTIAGLMEDSRLVFRVLGFMPLILTACVGVIGPFGHTALKTSEKYVSPAELKQIVAVRQTRTEVTQRFGEPTAVIDDVQAIGYEVCIDSEGVEVAVIIVPLPIWHNGLTKDCQRIGLWFDAQERAIGWREETMHMGESSSGWYHANLADWMSTNRPETR